MRALEQAKDVDNGVPDSDEEIAEVDLSKFDYDVDDEWLPPDVPNLPQK